jgi:hypothetical protein
MTRTDRRFLAGIRLSTPSVSRQERWLASLSLPRRAGEGDEVAARPGRARCATSICSSTRMGSDHLSQARCLRPRLDRQSRATKRGPRSLPTTARRSPRAQRDDVRGRVAAPEPPQGRVIRRDQQAEQAAQPIGEAQQVLDAAVDQPQVLRACSGEAGTIPRAVAIAPAARSARARCPWRPGDGRHDFSLQTFRQGKAPLRAAVSIVHQHSSGDLPRQNALSERYCH